MKTRTLKIPILLLMVFTGFSLHAQKVDSYTFNFTERAIREAMNPELMRPCPNCPPREAEGRSRDGGWKGIDNPEMPIPSNAIIKRQERELSLKLPKPKVMVSDIMPDVPSRAPLQNWLGHLDQGTIIPPDSHGAIGVNHVVTATNNFIRIHNKVGGAQVSQVTIDGFTGITGTCDPYMKFDPVTQRWLFSAIECNGANGNRVIVMTSNTVDPTGTWRTITFVPAIPGGNNFLDHPYLGFDGTKITISGRKFLNSSGSFTFRGPVLMLIDKAAMLAGTAITFGTNAQLIDRGTAEGDSPLPVSIYDPPVSNIANPNPGMGYVLQSWNGTSIRLTTVTGNIPTAAWNTGTPIIITSALPAWNNGNLPNTAQQTVETRRLSANDARISCGVMMNGTIWAAHHIAFPTTGTPDRLAIQWWQLDGGAGASLGNILQNGRIGGGTAGEYKWFPSIAVNQRDDVLIGYTASTTTTRVGAAYVTRQGNSPLNTTDEERIYHAGEDRYWKDFNSGRARWGDYSHTALDPVDNSLWTIQQYASTGAGAIPPDNNSRFGVWWAQVGTSPCPADVTITGTYNSPLTYSSTWIKSSGQTTIQSAARVRLDATPATGYVELLAPASSDFFLSQPTGNGLFVAQALDGCGNLMPTLAVNPGKERDEFLSDASGWERPLSVASLKATIFPNPGKGLFKIVFNGLAVEQINVYSMSGELIRKIDLNPGAQDYLLNITGQSKGTYKISLIGKDVVETRKLILE